MKHGTRLASAALALVLVLTLCGVSAFAATDAQSDVMQEWVDEGLLTGYEDGSLNEDGIITRAEFIHLMNLIGFTGDADSVDYTYTDVETNAWYYEDIMSATAAGYVSGRVNGSFGPRDTVTAQEAIAMVVRAMGLELDEETGAAETCSEWFAGEIGAAINAGLAEAGTDFTADLTRAEAVCLLDTVRDAIADETEEAEAEESTVTGEDVTITKKSQEIEDDTVANVTISSKLGSAAYTLDDVTITGDLTIESTGTITLDDVTVLGDIIIEGSGAKVVLKSSAEVATVIFHDSGTISGSSYSGTLESITVDTDSKYDVVYIKVDAETVIISSRAYVHISSDVGTLTVEEDASYASVEITKSANVEEVNLEATHVTLYGSGDIEQLNIDASYCTISKYLDIEDTDKASGVKGTSYSYVYDDDDDDNDDDDDDWWYDYYYRKDPPPEEQQPAQNSAEKTTTVTTGSVTLNENDTYNLGQNAPDGSTSGLTWSSDNEYVATVSSSGVVTAKAPGTATITAVDASGDTVVEWTVTVNATQPAETTESESTGEQTGETTAASEVSTETEATNPADSGEPNPAESGEPNPAENSEENPAEGSGENSDE